MKWYIILALIAGICIAGGLLWYFWLGPLLKRLDVLFKLPLQDIGMTHLPGVPFSIPQTLTTIGNLVIRIKQTQQATNGLQNLYQIGSEKANGKAFMYGIKSASGAGVLEDAAKTKEAVRIEMETAKQQDFQDIDKLKSRLSQPSPLLTPSPPHPLTQLSLTHPDQYAMGWTVFADVYQNSLPKLAEFSRTLMVDAAGVEAATEAFWPTIAQYGMAFNLILPEKVSEHEYLIDMTIFNTIKAHPEKNTDFSRFTPAVKIFLRQDTTTKNLIPYSIVVSDYEETTQRTFIKGDKSTSDSGWMYALQAAKTAITVWGIWLGHVYHWHIVTAALQMTMYQNLEKEHPIRTLLDPMSNHLIGFDDFLLLAFQGTAPPTSVPNGLAWMELENTYAQGRSYFDDDPKSTLKRLNITESDFTTDKDTPWNQYPIVGYMLEIWKATETYVTTYVYAQWSCGTKIVNDAPLQSWIKASGDPKLGNVKGLPTLTDHSTAQAELIAVLTSYIYRITVHGSSRMDAAANPALSFVGNFPPTLQISTIPPTNVALTTEELLKYLPNTGTIGSMLTFLFTFIFSPPYESFIPAEGIDQELFFGPDRTVPLNQALIQFRTSIEKVIKTYSKIAPTLAQWPRNIET